MGRWQPGALGRLQTAALDLFEERGYEATTVADIAARAGLTERTFYRHYADKREVLMAGGAQLSRIATEAIIAAPAAAGPWDAAVAGLVAVGPLFDERRAFSLRRQAIIEASPALQERELVKLDALAGSMSAALVARGVSPSSAELTAHAAIAVFRVTFGRWVADTPERPFADIVAGCARSLTHVAAGGRPTPEAL